MKSKLLLLSFLMLLTTATSFAQSSASLSGIAVQGIARDNNNSAFANQTITFEFTIYDPADASNPIYFKSIALTTDAFGVFSYIMDVDPSKNSKFYSKSLWLKIRDVTSGQDISDEVFKHVPYAISANNGVPTGSIMPYIGSEAPTGWVLCDGRALGGINGSEELIALVGNNAPNLGGMFLRGTGGSGDHVGPALKVVQNDSFESHLHDAGGLGTDTSATHTHSLGTDTGTQAFDLSASLNTDPAFVDTTMITDINNTKSTGADGAHSHVVKGNTAETGDSETRPVNYGVNYIIKL